MRKALIVGIDYYDDHGISNLSGCVNDAHSIKSILERHADGTVNFATPRLITGTNPSDIVTRADFKESIRELFSSDSDTSLLYFAGHGYIEDTGGFLCTGDCKTGDDGISLSEIMTLANNSPARNKIIILDSCHSGIAGGRPDFPKIAEIKEGMTILTASTESQYAMEIPGGGAGVFTSLFVDALAGAAANLTGDITPGSIYAHIDQSLGPWSAQRPMFKTNVQNFISLRKALAPIALTDLQKLATYFPAADYNFPLDPSYEPERTQEQESDNTIPKPNPNNTVVFSVLQKYVKVNLVRPVDAPHMYHAAMESKSCELTVLGEHYRKLVAENLI